MREGEISRTLIAARCKGARRTLQQCHCVGMNSNTLSLFSRRENAISARANTTGINPRVCLNLQDENVSDIRIGLVAALGRALGLKCVS
jgi:hypothetical protein